jgi:hypothetical protein
MKERKNLRIERTARMIGSSGLTMKNKESVPSLIFTELVDVYER